MYKDLVGWPDLFVVPLYLILLGLIMRGIAHRNRHNELYRRYFMPGFLFKIACAILYCLLIYYYWGMGDSIHYFKNVTFVRELMRKGVEDWSILFRDADYLRDHYSMEGSSTEAGWLLERIALVLCPLSFSRFITTSMLFATLAYWGMFRMFQAFCILMPEWHLRLAAAVLFFPTLGIYGSGILKDTLCMACLGWMVYASQRIWVLRRRRLLSTLILLLCLWCIFQVKIYIAIAFLIPYVVYLLMLAAGRIRHRLTRNLVFPAVLLMLVLLYTFNAARIDTLLGRYAVEKLLDNVKDQQQSYLNDPDAGGGSTFDIGNIEPTLGGLLSKMPQGINAALFRPYLWETRNPLMLFSAPESLILLLTLLWIVIRVRPWRFLQAFFFRPFVFLCLTYTVLFATLVGLSTSNFGTLARYRIPIIPFFLCGILLILYERLKDRKKPRESTG